MMAERDAVHVPGCCNAETAHGGSWPAVDLLLMRNPSPLTADECRNVLGDPPWKDKAPPPDADSIPCPAPNLKAFRELEPLLHDEDDEEIVEKGDFLRWLGNIGSACWRGHGAGSVTSRGGWSSLYCKHHPTHAIESIVP